MNPIDIFNIIAGLCSIISLIISVISLFFVNDVRKKISVTQNGEKSKSSINNSGQNLQAENITNSHVYQAHGDQK